MSSIAQYGTGAQQQRLAGWREVYLSPTRSNRRAPISRSSAAMRLLMAAGSENALGGSGK
jgi:hypothetical protein